MYFTEPIANQRVTPRFRRYLKNRLREGYSLYWIAQDSGYLYNTIRYEVEQNGGVEQYDPDRACERAEQLRYREKKGKIQQNRDLQAYIVECLEKGWSPKVIAGRAVRLGLVTSLSKDTIYAWIYSEQGQDLGLSHYLDSGKKKKGTRAVCLERQKTELTPQPEFGEWQADTICFNGRSTRVAVLLETRSRYVRLQRIEEDMCTSMTQFLEDEVRRFGVSMFSSLTVDMGREFKGISFEEFEVKVAGAGWEKGAVERVNRQLRRLGLSRWATPTDALIEEVETRLNQTPRESLDYETPEEVFLRLYKERL